MFVAIVGIIAAIALPALDPSSVSRDSSDRRVAQEMANLAAAAQIAGVEVVVSGDLRATVDLLEEGVSPADGPFKGRIFRLKGLTERSITGAMKYLKVSGDQLIYTPDPTAREGPTGN